MEAAVIIICLLLSAFFSGMEIAYVSANKVYLEVEKQQDAFLSKILSRLTQNPSRFVAAMLVGNSIALVIYSYYMGGVVLNWFAPHSLGWHKLLQLLLQTVIATAILLITAEFLPKVFFQVYANRIIKLLAVPAYGFYLLFSWVSKVVIGVSDFVLVKLFRTKAHRDTGLFSRGELGSYVTQQQAEEDEEADTEVQIFRNALVFSAVKAKAIMTPKTELAAVEINDTVDELRQLFLDTDYSKIVVYKDNPDNVVGYVHSFELFKNPPDVKSITLPVEKISGEVYIKELLTRLTRAGRSMAVVAGANDRAEGIVTVEDIIEELFGEIEDEHDNEETLVAEQQSGGAWLFSARYDVEVLNTQYGFNLPQSDLYSTLGGLIVHHCGGVPAVGHSISVGKYSLVIQQASAKYIELVKIVSQSV
ncbi:hemolysin [Flavobacterium akiainvivens]|uniref:Hemolysin n=1 Tax=Flavobacterium akiainvivens TaxID=1202724 RepID=A0A0M8MBJ3_9FLAO|nr:hemolysin family protein [Flavobacterium akiainvivens]KOS07703.1 hemolysin [Flavobacterium akiainvivens]SFQ24607.1 Hemolysin, contains CBS domains [Flavobacterium akiainvivens]